MGWFGPASGDCSCCTCTCSFVGGFNYNGTEPSYWGQDPPPICQLMFTVGVLQDDTCAPLDVATANITIVLKQNGTTITEPFIRDSANFHIRWTRWKPTAGDVYTADVTLDCGGGSSYSQSYSFTIPTPANTLCVCCDDQIPDYGVVSGLTGCCDFGNGTYAVSLSSTCQRDQTVSYSAPATGDRCNGSVACGTITLGTQGYPGGPFDVVYLHKKDAFFKVGVGRDPLTGLPLANLNEIQVQLDLRWYAYRKRFPFSFDPTFFECTSVSDYTDRWIFNSICNGYQALLSSSLSVCTGQTPDIKIYFQ